MHTKNTPEILKLITDEKFRQFELVNLIASENITYQSVLDAQGSILTNKYAEGYPGKRFYEGCEVVDEIESAAIENAKKLFKCQFANVQPHSGSGANLAVFFALLNINDKILAMDLSSGGHLTHGSKASQTSKLFQFEHYGLNENDDIDFVDVENKIKSFKPKLIIAGTSSYPKVPNWKKFAELAKKYNILFMADMAHVSGIVAAELAESPIEHADVVTSTTHKTLKGARGGLILTNNPEIAKKVNFANFPGTQGGPLMHVIAGKAISFAEALKPKFKIYISKLLDNAKAMADFFTNENIDLVCNGTETHLILISLQKFGLEGKAVCKELARAGIITNFNVVPNDPLPPTVSSGIRIGLSTITSLGLGTKESKMIAKKIVDIIIAMKDKDTEDYDKKLKNKVSETKQEIKNMMQEFI